MSSCRLNDGNLIMLSVISSSHGGYLAPADRGEGAGGIEETIETKERRKRVLSLMAERLNLKWALKR